MTDTEKRLEEDIKLLKADVLNLLQASKTPIGSIIAWHKSLTGVPALPSSWVECNGQTLNDAGSLLNGQVIPNLNGDAGGADSPGVAAKAQMFLRGGTASGTGQMDAFQDHKHNAGSGAIYEKWDPNTGTYADLSAGTGSGSDTSTGNANTWAPAGTVRTATETRPINMAVVWIMRIK